MTENGNQVYTISYSGEQLVSNGGTDTTCHCPSGFTDDDIDNDGLPDACISNP